MFVAKKRSGNMVLVVVVLVMLVLALTGLFSITTSQRENARQKAVDIGQTNTYIAIANTCADAFRKDLEGLYWLMNIANVADPDGDGYGIEVYDKAIQKFQTALQAGAPDAEGKWTYQLTDPYTAIEYAGVSDPDTIELLGRLLEGAKVDITVNGPLEIYTADDDRTTLETGDTVSVRDIIFTLKLTKGTWKVEQTYRLSGEKLTARYNTTQIRFAVDGTGATCELEKQTVTKNNILN